MENLAPINVNMQDANPSLDNVLVKKSVQENSTTPKPIENKVPSNVINSGAKDSQVVSTPPASVSKSNEPIKNEDEGTVPVELCDKQDETSNSMVDEVKETSLKRKLSDADSSIDADNTSSSASAGEVVVKKRKLDVETAEPIESPIADEVPNSTKASTTEMKDEEPIADESGVSTPEKTTATTPLSVVETKKETEHEEPPTSSDDKPSTSTPVLQNK